MAILPEQEFCLTQPLNNTLIEGLTGEAAEYNDTITTMVDSVAGRDDLRAKDCFFNKRGLNKKLEQDTDPF